MAYPVKLQIPVHAHFICPNTPGSRFPSHGIEAYGVEYAIDFVIVNDNGSSQKPYRSDFFTYISRGLPLSDFYGWGINVFSPINGVVVQVNDGIDERNPVKVANDLRYAVQISQLYKEGKTSAKSLLGNSVIVQVKEHVYVVLAHLQKNSILVNPGQIIDTFTVIGKLGHSGNSTMPHLHLQAMDNWDFRVAKGLPILFSQYYVINRGSKIEMHDSIPMQNQILFFRPDLDR